MCDVFARDRVTSEASPSGPRRYLPNQQQNQSGVDQVINPNMLRRLVPQGPELLVCDHIPSFNFLLGPEKGSHSGHRGHEKFYTAQKYA